MVGFYLGVVLQGVAVGVGVGQRLAVEGFGVVEAGGEAGTSGREDAPTSGFLAHLQLP